MQLEQAAGIKQSQLFFAAAQAFKSKSNIDTAFRLGAIGLGVYCIASVPCAAALETITLGTQYQVTTTTPGNSFCDVSSTSTAGTARGVSLDTGLNVITYTLNSTGAGSSLTLSSSPTISSTIPSICCRIDSPLCVSAWECGTDICVRPFNSVTQALSPITHANTVTSANIGGGDCTVLKDGNFAISWSSSNAGDYKIWQRTYDGTTGTALTSPLVVNLNTAVLQGENCIVALPTTPSTALIAWGGGTSSNYIVNYATVNTAAGTINRAAVTLSTDSSIQQQLSCFTSNGEGRVAWVRNGQGRVQRFGADGSLIGSNYLLQGPTATMGYPNGLGTPDGNALIIYQQNIGGFSSSYGATYASDATGTPQSSTLQIPSNAGNNGQNPGSLVLLGGTASNYNALSLFNGAQIAGIDRMYARPINVQGGSTTGPTPSPTPSPTPPTNSTPTPTSGGSSLSPNFAFSVSALGIIYGLWDNLWNHNEGE